MKALNRPLGLTDAEACVFCRRVVDVFVELFMDGKLFSKNSGLSHELADLTNLTDAQEHFHGHNLPRRGQWDGYAYLGAGPICLFFDWTGNAPYFRIEFFGDGTTDFVPDAPADTPHRVKQVLLENLRGMFDYDWRWMSGIITSRNWGE